MALSTKICELSLAAESAESGALAEEGNLILITEEVFNNLILIATLYYTHYHGSTKFGTAKLSFSVSQSKITTHDLTLSNTSSSLDKGKDA